MHHPFESTTSPFLARLPLLRGKRRNGLLFVAGLLGAAAFPPVGALPLLLIGLGLLLFLLDAAPTRRRAFADGWWFAYGLSVAGMYWIGLSMLVDAAKFGWMIPFAVFGLTAVIAIYGGLATLAAWMVPVRGWARVAMFALSWTGAEALRGTLLSGFPWNLLGDAWSGTDLLLQPASLVGVYGLSLLTALAAGAIAWPLLPRDYPANGPSWRQAMLGAGLCASLLLPALLYSCARLILAPESASAMQQQPGVVVRLVQPAIQQSLKWDPAHAMETVRNHLLLSRLQNNPAPTHIFWPEAALPFRLEETLPLVRDIARLTPKSGLVITGGVRVAHETPQGEIYNSLQSVDTNGQVKNLYDKTQLVPFGEFVPLRQWLPVDKITPGARDFDRGRTHQLAHAPGLPDFAPMICYEIIFPGYARQQAFPQGTNAPHAQWILNATNDAWFGTSSGPYQHLGQARMRAAELGLPVLRVANNGISAVIDAYGRVQDHLPLNAIGVLDAGLPMPLVQPTLVARFGYLPACLCALLIGLSALAAMVRARWV